MQKFKLFKKLDQQGRQKYCSAECQREDYYNRTHQQAYPELSTGTVGSIGELRVCADLLAKGYAVFRAVSVNCWTDLVVQVGDKFFSIEVKTGQRMPSGKLRFPKPRAKTDIIAIVLPDGIVYLLEVIGSAVL
jgi:hypothetical protein